MLHLNELTYRIGDRLLIDSATVALPTGAHVGLVGRNGAGKTTLFRLIAARPGPESGAISLPRGARIGRVEQEAPGGPQSLIDFVLDADVERRELLHEAESARRSRAHRRNPDPARRHRGPRRARARGAHPLRPRLRRGGAGPRTVRILRRLADAGRAGRGAVLGAGPAAARRTDQLSRPRRRALASRLSEDLSRDHRSSSATIATCSTTSPTTSCISSAASSAYGAAAIRSFERQRAELISPAGQDREEAGGDGASTCRPSSTASAPARPRRARPSRASRCSPRCSQSPPSSTTACCRSAGRRWRKKFSPPIVAMEKVSAGYGERAVLSRIDLTLAERRPHRADRRQRQRQVDLRQADRRPARADVGQDGSRAQQARRRLLRPASGRRARRDGHALHPCRRAHARRDRKR